MTDLVLHVGAPKTGTKLIQMALRTNQEALEARGDAIVLRRELERLTVPTFGQRQRRGEMLSALESFWPHLAQRCSGARRAVVTHEGLLGTMLSFRDGGRLYPDAAALLAQIIDAVAPSSVRVVLRTRRQDTYVESVYLQRIRMGKHFTWSDFVATVDPSALSWTDLCHRIAAVVGRDGLVVRPFEELHADARAYVADFFTDAGLGAEPQVDFDTDARNRSYSQPGLEIALVANRVLDREGRRKVRGYLDKHLSNRTHPKPVLFSAEERRQLLALLDATNDELFETYASETAVRYRSSDVADVITS